MSALHFYLHFAEMNLFLIWFIALWCMYFVVVVLFFIFLFCSTLLLIVSSGAVRTQEKKVLASQLTLL